MKGEAITHENHFAPEETMEANYGTAVKDKRCTSCIGPALQWVHDAEYHVV